MMKYLRANSPDLRQRILEVVKGQRSFWLIGGFSKMLKPEICP